LQGLDILFDALLSFVEQLVYIAGVFHNMTDEKL